MELRTNLPQIERRVMTTELRVEPRSDGGSRIIGYAAVFNAWSVDLGGFRERVQPGAFAETIANDDIRALFNHDPNFIIGRNVSRTLRLSEDAHGLLYEVDVPDTQAGRDLLVSIERGDVSGNSFGFRTIEDAWTHGADLEERTLVRVRLHDISPVVYPAYPQTELALRSLQAFQEEAAKPAEDPHDAELDLLAPYLRSAQS